MIEETEVKVGGFTFKGWYIAAALPILGSLSGGIYYGYDTLQRFYAVESGIETVVQASSKFSSKATTINTKIQTLESETNTNIQELELALSSRIQAIEQAVADNDVRGLNTRLSTISTQMQTILEQQKELLDLRSQVERSTGITDSLGDKLDKYQTEIDDIWKAYDSLVENPLQ
jgi:chromosome segregation ATPase